MKGNSLNQFVSDMLEFLGPEKEFTCGNKYYIIQGDRLQPGSNITGLRVDVYENINDDAGEFIEDYFFPGEKNDECFEKFVKAKIFDGKTFYEVENDIEVLYG